MKTYSKIYLIIPIVYLLECPATGQLPNLIFFLSWHLFLPILPLSLIPSFLFIHRIFTGERARRERERDETKTNRGNCSTAADAADGRQQPTSSALSFPATASALGRRRIRARPLPPPRRVGARTPPLPRRVRSRTPPLPRRQIWVRLRLVRRSSQQLPFLCIHLALAGSPSFHAQNMVIK